MKSLLFYIQLFLVINTISAQSKMVCLSGTVDSSITKSFNSKILAIRFKHTTNPNSQGEYVSLNISNDGTFSTQIKVSDFTYVSFEMLNLVPESSHYGSFINMSYPSRPWFFEQNEVYLIEPLDSLNVRFMGNGEVSFEGRGSEKLNCQYQMYSINPSPEAMFNRSTKLESSNITGKLAFEESILNLTTKLRLEILKTYKAEISEHAYRLLYLDAISSTAYFQQSTLYENAYISPIDINSKILQEYKFHALATEESVYNTDEYAQSAYYADILFLREWNTLRINSKTGNYSKGDSFKSVYEVIKNKYNGQLRAKLILICYEYLSKAYADESKLYIDDALSILNGSMYHIQLSKIKLMQNAMFPFELQDTLGKNHKLKDYSGKILIIDFWFTGCTACKELYTAMNMTYTQLKKDKDVVFITINVDPNRNTWIKSLSTGNYTDTESVNLHTNGLGVGHPIVSYFNIIGYPKQLIVGKKGEIISSSPPDVRLRPEDRAEEKNAIQGYSFSRTNEFIKIIRDYQAATE